ncbi:sensor histidine kinase [Ethanoligenens sp.]|uniref:sensor histidine kinase n=1 Tax=Ethanoligenens sp. TaxID=2099655 RepID=UPI0039E83F3D
MTFGLRTKLSLAYAALALLLVGIISLFVNYFFKIQFNDYVIAQQKQSSQNIVNLVEKQYDASNDAWNVSAIENIGMSALDQGIILKVKDLNGKDVWDATVHNNGLCMQMLSQMAQYTQKYNPTLKGGYVQTGYDLTNDFQKIGQADVGYYGPYFYTSNDVSFLNRVNTILVIVGIASLALAFLLGAIMSRRLSRPISKAIEAASEISRGNFKQRIKEQSTTREIKQLTATVNDLADSLEKQQQLRKTMAADVSHELRTPLASLQSSLEAIIDGIWEPSRERLESCHEEILRINRLVGDLEKLERAEAENTMLNMTELNLSELAQHIVHNFETDFFKKSVKLNFVCDSVAVKADRDKISQVIINLLSNALKYTQKGGRVELQVRDNGRSAKLIVSDTGNGISQDDIPNIFERLYRADKSRNRVTGGSGLGLTITKAIIEAHKGSISVSSELDKGTAFTVSLPKSRG